MIPGWFPDADTWAAWAQCITATIALGAAYFAYQQVKEARDTRERVTQPEVVVFVDHHQIRRYVDLVIKNFGQTTAYNIRITLPPLEVARYANQDTVDEVTHVLMPKKIAVLAPGQEWRTVWDSVVRREKFKGKLQDQYGGLVEFDDKVDGPGKRSYRNPIALDIKMFWNTMWIERSSNKSVERALYNIAGTLKSYGEEHDGVWVYTVPGDEERRRRELEFIEDQREYEELLEDIGIAQQRNQQPTDENEGEDD